MSNLKVFFFQKKTRYDIGILENTASSLSINLTVCLVSKGRTIRGCVDPFLVPLNYS